MEVTHASPHLILRGGLGSSDLISSEGCLDLKMSKRKKILELMYQQTSVVYKNRINGLL
jgi:hypothetical protein